MLKPRRISRRTPLETANKTLEQCLAGENVDDLLKALSPTERGLLEEIVAEIRTSGASPQLDQLWHYDYIRKPPTMAEFVDDPYWLGAVTAPSAENPGLWPTWRSILTSDFDLNSRIHNCVITGSLGIGKTWNMVIILLYRLTIASLLRNPHNFVGLAAGSKIIYVLMSVTRAQVQDTAFGEALNIMGKSPYFVEELRFDPALRYSGQTVDLGRGLQLNAGSKSQHIIGRNTLGIGMDEGNFRLEARPDASAFKLFNEVRTRLKNRFQKTSGFLPAISIIASSARDESSFTEMVINEIHQKGDPSTEQVYAYPVYHMKNRNTWIKLGASPEVAAAHANQYSAKWFKVAYGLKNVAPEILQGWYDEDGNEIGAGAHPAAPTGARTVLVPSDYHAEYSRDTLDALQSLSGISIGGSYRLFTSTIDLEWCVAEGEKSGVVNPATLLHIPISEEDDREIWDFLEHPRFLIKQLGIVKPRRHPEALRFAHMDLATRSKAGLAICHKIGYTEIKDAVDRRTGSIFAEHRLMVEYDFILTIVSGRSKPISFEKIQKFFIWLRDRCNFRWGLITADTFQSFMQLQMLETRNFPTGSLSLDRSKAPYHAWRSGIEEHRVFMYRQAQLMAEAEKLIDGAKMVDHPADGDVTCLLGSTKLLLADGVARSIRKLAKNERNRTVLAYSGSATVSAQGLNARCTGQTQNLVRVTLDNNRAIHCTPTHRFLRPDGSYTEARYLQPRDQLRGPRIVRVRRVETWVPAVPQNVYDITVPHYENFLLDAGVFVHNSKDTTDAAAGAYFNCINNATETDPTTLAHSALIQDSSVAAEEDTPPVTINIPPYRRRPRTFVS